MNLGSLLLNLDSFSWIWAGTVKFRRETVKQSNFVVTVKFREVTIEFGQVAVEFGQAMVKYGQVAVEFGKVTVEFG